MSKVNRYENVKFIYVYDYVSGFDNNNNETVQKHPVAVICTGKIGTEYHGKVGVSICSENDKFVYAKGRSIAFQRLINAADLPIVGKTFIRNVKWNGHIYKVNKSYPEFMIQLKNGEFVRVNEAIAEIVNDIQNTAIATQRYAEYLANPEIGETWQSVKAELDL